MKYITTINERGETRRRPMRNADRCANLADAKGKFTKEVCDESGVRGTFWRDLATWLMEDANNETIDRLCEHYDSRIAKQAGVMAETADMNIRLKRENIILRNIIGLDRCGDCIACEDDIDETCPWAGEPNGCNNRDCQQAYKVLMEEAK